MSHSIRISQCFLALGLGACSGNVVNLGEGQAPPPEPLPSYSRCLESTTVEGDVVVSEQAQIDELEGCEAVRGDLSIHATFNPDLRPLHALQTVGGTLGFGIDPDELHADVLNYMAQVMADGWLGSFEGLEALRTVGGLTIVSPAASDLQPLSGLTALTRDGLLDIEGADNLRDLAPLAQLEGIHGLQIRGDQLESIADLRLGAALDWMIVYGARLSELGALDQVRRLTRGVSLSGTGLRDLSSFSSLESVETIEISNNPELRSLAGLESLTDVTTSTIVLNNPRLDDISALGGLRYTADLAINDNQRLRRIPDFPALQLKTLSIMSNASLEEIENFTGLFNHWHPIAGTNIDIRDNRPSGPTQTLVDRLKQLVITGNPLLTHYTAPLSSRGAEQVVIAANASLVDLDLGTIATADLVSIKANPALAHVSHALATVDVLSVLGNPALPLDSFDTVQTFQRELSSDPITEPDCSRAECAP